MARAAGFIVTWEDFADLAAVTPLLARIYPNGSADVNQFHAVGGLGFVIRELIDAGLLFEDIGTVNGAGLSAYASEAVMDGSRLVWRAPPDASLDAAILAPARRSLPADGRARARHRQSRARHRQNLRRGGRPHDDHRAGPRLHSQAAFQRAFKAGAFTQDVVVVLTGQGPEGERHAELHGLMPPLAVLQSRGLRVALLTDGRLSGASGKILSALHVTPEAKDAGPISRLRDGDVVTIDAGAGVMSVALDEATLMAREPERAADPGSEKRAGSGLFAHFRANARRADVGADALWA